MDIRVSGMVWFKKTENPSLADYLRKKLLIVPRKLGNYGDNNVKPTPIKCWSETPEEFGVPRAFWFSTVKGDHEYEWDITFGSPTDVESKLKHEGPYVEQAEIVSTLESYFDFVVKHDETSPEFAGRGMGGILQAQPGFGKSNVALEFIKRKGCTALILVHKEFLLRQWVNRIYKWLPNAKVGIVQGPKCEFEGKDIVVGMIESLALEDGTRYPEELYDWPGVLVIDECFPGAQKVMTEKGCIPISDVAVGDVVKTAVGEGYVKDVIRRKVGFDAFVMVATSLEDVICTKDHPFLTERGWIKAGDLTLDDILIDMNGCIDIMRRHGDILSGMWGALQTSKRQGSEVLLKGMLRGGKDKTIEQVRRMRQGYCEERQEFDRKEWTTKEGEEQFSFLFKLLSDELVFEECENSRMESEYIKEGYALSPEKPSTCFGYIRKDEEKKSYVSRGCKGKGVKASQGCRVEASDSRREWKKNTFSSEKVMGSLGGGMEFGISCQDLQKESFSLPLQGGCCQQGGNDSSRSGWPKSQFVEGSGEGQEENFSFGRVRVESVSFPKRRDFERLGYCCSKDSVVNVYNLSVSGHPSYVLGNGLVVHNCHRVSAPSWNPVPQRFSSAYRLGLTATPRRKDGTDPVFWWHIGPIIYKAKTEMPRPFIRMVQIQKPFNYPPLLSRQESNDAIVVTILGKLTARNWRITHEIVKALKSPVQRKVLVLSERLDHLRKLESELKNAVRQSKDLTDITTSFYVGEWFTGEVVPRLKAKEWDMENGGRESAIKLIYTSISRRKGYSGEIGERDGQKIHSVFIEESDLRSFDPDGNHDGSETVTVVLEDLSDDAILSIAVWFKIRQKKEERLRKLTEEELFEAERARVLFATFQMLSEGADIPAIDTVVFVTPMGDVEQATGRGRRYCLPDPSNKDKCLHFCPWRADTCEGKGPVIVADIVDLGFPLCSKRERWRKQWYWDQGFKVVEGS